MNTKLKISALVFITALGISFAYANHHAVKTQENAALGTYLTDTEGKTLYWFTKDVTGKSECNGPCLKNWPVFYRETVAPPAGVKADDFATITRGDGQKQTAFRGYPLYYFAGDKAAGQATGQGVKNVWYVINPGNFPPK